MLFKVCVGYYSWDDFFVVANTQIMAERNALAYAKEKIHPKSEIVKSEAIKEVSLGLYKIEEKG